MFDDLGEKFDGIFKRLRGQGRISEDNIKEAVREVRLALLEADVNLMVVKQLIAALKEKALGQEVLTSVNPGQQFVKIVQDELTVIMGGQAAPFELGKGKLNVILLLGLQGAGKTTFAGKLARRFKEEGFRPFMIACDIHRPAAIKQLHVVGETIGVPVFDMGTDNPAEKVAAEGLKKAKAQGHDLVIVDTAGRLHVDEVKMDELIAIKKAVKPTFSFFVADAMTGNDAANSARLFHEGIDIDGVCLTKLDGDARGGAALSIKTITGKPIFFVGVGERPEDLEMFHPDRMAGRILGMGDVISLVEKAQSQIDEKQAEQMQEKLAGGTFSLADWLDQMRMVKKMGPLSGLMKMIPGMRDAMKQMGDDVISDDMMKPVEAMIYSMTPAERDHPELINGSRAKRIAKGSGSNVNDLNRMIKEFMQTRKMMQGIMGGGGMGGMMKGGMKKMLGGKKPEDMTEEDLEKLRSEMPDGMPGGMPGGRGGRDPYGAGPKTKPKHRRKQKSKKNKKKNKHR